MNVTPEPPIKQNISHSSTDTTTSNTSVTTAPDIKQQMVEDPSLKNDTITALPERKVSVSNPEEPIIRQESQLNTNENSSTKTPEEQRDYYKSLQLLNDVVQNKDEFKELFIDTSMHDNSNLTITFAIRYRDENGQEFEIDYSLVPRECPPGFTDEQFEAFLSEHILPQIDIKCSEEHNRKDLEVLDFYDDYYAIHPFEDDSQGHTDLYMELQENISDIILSMYSSNHENAQVISYGINMERQNIITDENNNVVTDPITTLKHTEVDENNNKSYNSQKTEDNLSIQVKRGKLNKKRQRDEFPSVTPPPPPPPPPPPMGGPPLLLPTVSAKQNKPTTEENHGLKLSADILEKPTQELEKPSLVSELLDRLKMPAKGLTPITQAAKVKTADSQELYGMLKDKILGRRSSMEDINDNDKKEPDNEFTD